MLAHYLCYCKIRHMGLFIEKPCENVSLNILWCV